MNSRTVATLLGLLNDRDFVALRATLASSPVPWDQFCRMAMPQGLTPRQTWEVLAAIDHGAGFQIPSGSPELESCWYMITPHMASILYEIEARCRTNSPLSQALLKRSDRRFVIQPLVGEILACAGRDGLSLDYEAVRELISENRRPRNDVERLIANVHELLVDHQRYAGQDFDPDMVRALAAQIGREAENVTADPLSYPIRVTDPSYVGPDRALEWICSWVNGNGRYPESHVAITAIQISGAFWSFRPLPKWNALVEMVVRRIFLERRGYAALACVPLGTLELEWEQGRSDPHDVYAAYGEAWLESSLGGDQTPYFSTLLNLMRRGLDALEAAVHSLELRDEDLVMRLAGDPRINHRQRQILGQALLATGAEFDIATHARSHAIARSTARGDLSELVDMGFLRLESHGNKLLFRASPNLRVLLENHEYPRLFA